MHRMQYIAKYATEDKIRPSVKCTDIVNEPYFDNSGILQPGYATKFEITHPALLALMMWSSTADITKPFLRDHKIRFMTFRTPFNYEVQTILAMMNLDNFNREFKTIALASSLRKARPKSTTYEKQREKAELMKKEQDRLFDIGEVKVRLRKTRGRWCWDFLAATHIQRWWLRNHRKFRIYKNIYQLMDEYAVEGGFTGQDSAKYFGIGKDNTPLLRIQENIMNKVDARRAACQKLSRTLVDTTLQKVMRNATNRAWQKEKRRAFFAEREWFNISHGYAPTIYGFGPSNRWGDHDEPYYCEPCATNDLSYPGDGRSSGSLENPRWAAQCSRCGQKNPYYKEKVPSPPPSPPPSPSCDEGPSGDEGPPSFLGHWARKLGLTK